MRVLSTAFFIMFSLLSASNVIHAAPSPYISFEVGAGIYHDNLETAAFLGDGGYTDRLAFGLLWNIDDRLQAGIESGINAFQDSHGVPLLWNAKSNKQRSSVDLLAVTNFALSQKFDIFARAGMAYSWYKYELTGIEWWTEQPYSYSGTTHSWRPKAGVGAAYNINEHFAVKLSFNNEFASDWAATTLLGLQYNF